MLKQLRWLLFSFRGRLPRAPFWWACVWLWIVFIGLFIALDKTLGYASTLILYPPLLLALAALCVKRMHDRGKTPWWFLPLLIPILGVLWLFFEMAFARGSTGENQYGADPTEHRHDYLTVA